MFRSLLVLFTFIERKTELNLNVVSKCLFKKEIQVNSYKKTTLARHKNFDA